MTGKIIIAICVAIVIIITLAACKVSGRCSREEEKEDGKQG